MTLQEYATKHGLALRDLCEVFGMPDTPSNRRSVHRWQRGLVVPELRRVLLIERHTKGAVTPYDWPDRGRSTARLVPPATRRSLLRGP